MERTDCSNNSPNSSATAKLNLYVLLFVVMEFCVSDEIS